MRERAARYPELRAFSDLVEQRLVPALPAANAARAGGGASMKAMVLAAGRGERMRPLTDARPSRC